MTCPKRHGLYKPEDSNQSQSCNIGEALLKLKESSHLAVGFVDSQPCSLAASILALCAVAIAVRGIKVRLGPEGPECTASYLVDNITELHCMYMKVQSRMQTLPQCFVKPLKNTIHQAPVLDWCLGVNSHACPIARNKTATESNSSPLPDVRVGADILTIPPAENKKEQIADLKRDLIERQGPGDQFTTMMVRNLPCNMTLGMFAKHMDIHGFAGCYDLIHLPHMSGSPNLGYGFVNFCSQEDAARFEIQFQKVSFTTNSSIKACRVQRAHIQGFMNNVEFIFRTKHFDQCSVLCLL